MGGGTWTRLDETLVNKCQLQQLKSAVEVGVAASKQTAHNSLSLGNKSGWSWNIGLSNTARIPLDFKMFQIFVPLINEVWCMIIHSAYSLHTKSRELRCKVQCCTQVHNTLLIQTFPSPYHFHHRLYLMGNRPSSAGKRGLHYITEFYWYTPDHFVDLTKCGNYLLICKYIQLLIRQWFTH